MRKTLCLISAGLFLVIGLLPVWGQGPGATPGATPLPPGVTAPELSFSATMQKFAQNAAQLVPALANEIERAVEGWLFYLAVLLAILCFFLYVPTAFAREGGAGRQGLGAFSRWLVGVILIFAALWYSGDINGDGRAGDAVDYVRAVGNSLAFGAPSSASTPGNLDQIGGFMAGRLQSTKAVFDASYREFTAGAFTVKVNGADVPVRPPTASLEERLFVPFSSGFNPQKVKDGLNPDGWDLANLFSVMNVARGILELADLYLLVLLGILGLVLRLTFPLVVACCVHKDLRGKIASGYFFSFGVIALVLPLYTQFMRFAIFRAGVLAFQAARPEHPYFLYDPTTSSILPQGNPVYLVALLTFLMLIGALLQFAAPFLAFKLATGAVVEGFTSAVSGWFSGLASTGIGYVTSSLSAAYATQAVETDAAGQLAVASNAAVTGRQTALTAAAWQRYGGNLNSNAQWGAAQTTAQADFVAGQTQTYGAYYAGRAGIQATQLSTVGGAAIQTQDKLANLNVSEQTSALRQYVDYWAANGNAEAQAMQKIIAERPEVLDYGAKQFGQYLQGTLLVGTIAGFLGVNADTMRNLGSLAVQTGPAADNAGYRGRGLGDLPLPGGLAGAATAQAEAGAKLNSLLQTTGGLAGVARALPTLGLQPAGLTAPTL